jgi:hypothetical protein
MPKPPGVTTETRYVLYDKGNTCMKFQRTFDPAKKDRQIIFIGLAIYKKPGTVLDYTIQNYFFQDELVTANDCPAPQTTSQTLKMFIPDWLTTTFFTTSPLEISRLTMTDFFI